METPLQARMKVTLRWMILLTALGLAITLWYVVLVALLTAACIVALLASIIFMMSFFSWVFSEDSPKSQENYTVMIHSSLGPFFFIILFVISNILIDADIMRPVYNKGFSHFSFCWQEDFHERP